MAFSENVTHGTSNGTSDVTMAAAPGSSTVRAVTGFTIHNTDTADATVTVKLDDTVNERTIIKVTLNTGDQLFWGRDDSPIYLPDTSTSLELVLGGTVSTNELIFTAYFADIT